MMQNLSMPNIAKLDDEGLEALDTLIKEQEHLINANGYRELSRVIKDILSVLIDDSFTNQEKCEDIEEAIANSLDHIHRIEFIGSCVAEIVAGLSTPNQCIIKYLSKFGDWVNA